MQVCKYRGVWKKQFKTQIYGCSYYKDQNSLSYTEQCPHEGVNIRKCEKFEEVIEGDEE